jgi:serine/threonine protein kinase/Flp pilus assembly protein TadD
MPTSAASAERPSTTDALVEEAARDLARRWRAGEQVGIEEYLDRYPELRAAPRAAVELLFEEVCLREEAGLEVEEAELLRRFPAWAAEIRVLLDCQRLLDGGNRLARFPEVGDAFGDFRLLAELGRGAQGRVFLAAQPALADRQVVLKLVPAASVEHLSLARLQHSHIVPLYSVHDDSDRDLRALCMPYFGGASLARVLELLAEVPPAERTGERLVEALERAAGSTGRGPAGRFLASLSYPRAIAWIGACLADALQYAHERGLVHLDLKPSNVLLAGDGTPMLLDFHLARPPIPAGAAAPDRLGGTRAYMPPEQQLALAAVREGGTVPEAVDGRADLFALGALLYQALTGALTSARARLRQRNPAVSVGLADVVGRCLAREPDRRYAGAAELAADLRRHLADLPLHGAGNRSLAERWRKWRRRRPFALPLIGLLLAAAAVAVPVLGLVTGQTAKARAALARGQAALEQGRPEQAQANFEHGLALIEDVPFLRELPGELRAGLARAGRARAAQELHRFLERAHGLRGDVPLSDGDARAVAGQCRLFWDNRELISDLIAGEAPARADLSDLAVLWADCRARRDGRRAALAVIEEAEARFGGSAVLAHERRRHAGALGLPVPGDVPPRAAWEHRAIGQALLRAGELAQAEAAFDRALALDPGDLWAYFCKGRCAFRCGRFEDAVVAFTACVTLAPRSAWCACNRGLAYAEMGRLDHALRDLDRAVALEPGLADAALHRGIVQYRRQRFAEALADLERAADAGAAADRVHYARALVRLAREDRDGAIAELRRCLEAAPGHAEAAELLAQLTEDDGPRPEEN